MARGEKLLTARGVAALVEPGRYADGGGLYLVIGKNNRRSWFWFYYKNGRRVEMGLGPASTLGLKDARDLRDKYRLILQAGGDPIAARKGAAPEIGPTFRFCSERLIAMKASGWRSEKHKAQWKTTLAQHASILMDKPIRQIDTAAVLSVLQPIWAAKAETASRVRGRVEAVIDWAKVHGHFEGENPARWRGHLDKILPKRLRLVKGHHLALPYQEAPAFMAALRAREGISARAFEFCILAAARSGEVMCARWSEIDLRINAWIIPGERMKSGREHRVPLTKRMLLILADMEGLDEDFVFAGRKSGTHISRIMFRYVLARMGAEVTPHGFRSTFRDWAGNETHFPREVAEMCLSHVIGDAAEQAYRRQDALEKRRALMQAWDDYLLSGEVKVVPITKAAG